jgi:HK97 family phage portal protein
MRLFGWDVSVTRAKSVSQLARVDSSRGGWWPVIREPYTTAWQAGAETSAETVLAYSAVYACVTLIASDIAKLGLRLVKLDAPTGIWSETTSPAFSPVLRRPNHYQNRIQFFTWWYASKLLHGNAYALKRRDGRGVVNALYLLDPTRVSPLVAPDGSVFYELRAGNLAQLAGLSATETVVVPAREIIHDVCVPLFHPLIGVTPLYACGLAAYQGLKIQSSSTSFFANGARPGGVLTAPGVIQQATADRLKEYFEENFGGDNAGKVAVLGDGLKYEPMAIKATDAQLIEQLKWTGEDVCTAYHVPAFMVGIGPLPPYNNIEPLLQAYYSQCLQNHIESGELLLDEGLELPTDLGTEFVVEDLIRMDSVAKMKVATEGVGGAILTPNEARKRFDLRPVPGGNTPYLQQQYYSLEALNKRDQAPPTPPDPKPAPTPGPPPPPESDGDEPDVAKQLATTLVVKRAQRRRRRAA